MTSAGNRWRLNEIDFTKHLLRQLLTAELPETFYRLPDITFAFAPELISASDH